jgi:hypothetical protein
VRGTKALGCAVVALSVVSLAAAPAQATTDTLAWTPVGAALLSGLSVVPAPASTVDFTGTADLRGRSASVVRPPHAQDRDQALLPTNGHCSEGVRPIQEEVIVDQPSHRPFDLLDAAGGRKAVLQTRELAYATMTGTDIA